MKKNKKKIKIIMFLIIIILFLIIFIFSKSTNTPISKIIPNIFKVEEEGVNVTYNDTKRAKLNFNYGWIFSKGEGKNNASSDLPVQNVTVIPNDATILPYSSSYQITDEHYGTNNEVWTEVSLPHTYNDADTFDTFTESGYRGDRSTYSGTAWYKKEFYIPAEYQGKEIYIEFEAARQAAKVYLNGNLLTGIYENGFIPFGYNLTQYINYGGTNDITVMVDNSYPYYMAGTNDIVSWHDSHWHPNYGGLYRNSYLYVVEPVHLTLPLYSFLESEGTYVYASNITNTTADINVEAQVENSTEQTKKVKLAAYIKNMNNTALLEIVSSSQEIASGEKAIIKISDTLTEVKRWSTTYPYLYTVECKLIVEESGQEVVVDNNSTSMGIRTFKFTNDTGFYLNGHYIKLQGWGQKSTNEWAGLGAAYPDWLQDYVLKLMKDAGSNFLRWGHTAGSPTQITAADKYGIVTMQPGVDGEGETVGGAYTANTYKLRTDAFRDMIIYYRNNPSILIWEIGNQIIPTNVSQTIVGYIQRYDHGNRGYTTQNENGDYSYNSTETKVNTGTNISTSEAAVRLASVRRGTNTTMVPYVGIGTTTEGSGGMNTDTYGYKPEVEGEYNRLESRRGVWDIYTKGFENFKNQVNSASDTSYVDVTSEKFAVYQVTSYVNMISRANHCGGANWIFSDSISHGRVGSEVSRASGEVDATMLPKESYWVTKVIFSDTPSAHIIGHWNYEAGTVKTVYAVANCDGQTSATLTVTNLSGTQTVYNGVKSKNYLWTFDNVLYEEGIAELEVKDINENDLVSDSIITHGTPSSLNITPIVSPNGLLANGSDILLLDIELLDSNGNRCETFDGEVENISTHFAINSQTNNELSDTYCVWKGGYNSGIEYTINKKDLYLEAGITRVAIRTTMNAGPISVTASMAMSDDSVLSDTYTITSTAINNTNGYTTLNNTRLPYDINGLEDWGIGEGSVPEEDITEETSIEESALVESVSYTGSINLSWGIESVLENGAVAYSDSDITFTSVPYKYLNAEYLKLPSADNGALAVDLINFSASKNIDVLVFRDPSVENPEWLSNYTLTPDIVTTSDGKIYRIYKRSILESQGITIGGNGDTSTIGSSGAMNIIAFKETEKVENEIFFCEKFQDSDGVPTSDGWTFMNGEDTTVIPTMNGNLATLQFKDHSTTSYIEAYKRFAVSTGKIRFSYDIYVNGDLNEVPIANKFIRTFLHSGVPLSLNDMSKTITEVYLDAKDANTKTTVNLITRTNSTGNNNINIKENIPVYEWYTYEYEVDFKTKTFTAKVYETSQAENSESINPIGTYSFNNNQNNSANHILLGSGNSSLNNFYISDIDVTPIPSTAVTGISVGDQSIEEFNVFTKAYLVKALPGSNININTRDSNVNTQINYNSNYTQADITVTDTIDNTVLNYIVYLDNGHANKTELNSIMSYISGIDNEVYTTATWSNLLNELEDAQIIMDQTDTTQVNINAQVQQLTEAIKTLKIDRAKVINKYFLN